MTAFPNFCAGTATGADGRPPSGAGGMASDAIIEEEASEWTL